ncbi:GNAT family N-acetyltransferase [Kitasatospora sp. NBC_01539]|uniref:GNAT family N-acetyltransferase n=1 Tax=Kitasatospora sp. NBC_01539 TaxID=2903577 RepID=UPI00386015F1
MDIVIRRALAEDLAGAGTVTVEAFVAGGHTAPGSAYAARLRDARPRSEEAELLVAVDPADGRVLGSVTFAPGGTPWADVAGPHEGEIRMLAVAPSARGRGVGAALVTAAADRSRALGLAGMAFSTMADMSAAHRLYERLGFRRSPDRDWSPRPGLGPLMVYSLTF